ncbi:hypothetical protein F0562_007934 [Nyssa sinensis]|uniref:Uncharacterized protein n=1 Tax=Nyssa sinensis TaxID=561372 RepID=A0A5J5A824_9ASTE|nr:hypothetical protein F0562_007934 [Nyssa sinensis]
MKFQLGPMHYMYNKRWGSTGGSDDLIPLSISKLHYVFSFSNALDLIDKSHSKCLADCDLMMDSSTKLHKARCNPAAAAGNRHLCENCLCGNSVMLIFAQEEASPLPKGVGAGTQQRHREPEAAPQIEVEIVDMHGRYPLQDVQPNLEPVGVDVIDVHP